MNTHDGEDGGTTYCVQDIDEMWNTGVYNITEFSIFSAPLIINMQLCKAQPFYIGGSIIMQIHGLPLIVKVFGLLETVIICMVCVEHAGGQITNCQQPTAATCPCQHDSDANNDNDSCSTFDNDLVWLPSGKLTSSSTTILNSPRPSHQPSPCFLTPHQLLCHQPSVPNTLVSPILLDSGYPCDVLNPIIPPVPPHHVNLPHQHSPSYNPVLYHDLTGTAVTADTKVPLAPVPIAPDPHSIPSKITNVLAQAPLFPLFHDHSSPPCWKKLLSAITNATCPISSQLNPLSHQPYLHHWPHHLLS